MRQERDTVDSTIARQRGAGRLANGREVIDAGYRLAADCAGVYYFWPADDQRFTNSTFVRIALARTQGSIAGYAQQSSIVAGEEHYRFFRYAALVDRGGDFTHGIVNALDHRGVRRIILVCRLFGLVFCNYIFFALDGRVDCVMSHIQKDWLILVAANKLDCFIRFTVGQVLTVSAGGLWGDFSPSVTGVGV